MGGAGHPGTHRGGAGNPVRREAEQMSLLESCPQRHMFSQCLPRSPSLGIQEPLGWKPL